MKQCVGLARVRRQNHAVVAVLNDQISREFGTDHRLNIRTVLCGADTNERFLQSIIDSVSDIRSRTEYTPATDTGAEVRNTLRFGFAGKVTAQPAIHTPQAAALESEQGQLASSAGETNLSREQLFWYNRTMNDLYNRFPKLRDIPAISSLDLDSFIEKPNKNQSTFGIYHYENRSLELAPFDMSYEAWKILMAANIGYLTPKQDFSGFIHHEYAHYLSNLIVPEKQWVPKLVEALKLGGLSNASIRFVDGVPEFAQETADRIAKSVSGYAAKNAREFAAEVLSWYMNPEYGKSVAPMPGYLERWVRGCFPMLDTD